MSIGLCKKKKTGELAYMKPIVLREHLHCFAVEADQNEVVRYSYWSNCLSRVSDSTLVQ